MDPITHFMTGACLSRAGFNRKTAYATLAMTLAAEAPDLDVFVGFRGPLVAFEHHRGITHTFFAAPIIALVTTGVVWLIHKWSSERKRRRKSPVQKPGLPPTRWLLIWLFALIADLSHLLLDYTNDYGIRPFLPFNPHWYARSIVFIIDPLIFFALLGALVMPWLFGLADSEIGARRMPFRGRGWAIAALVFIALWWSLRNAEHTHALELVRNAGITTEPIAKIAADPSPIDPFSWRVTAETADYYQIAQVQTWHDDVQADSSNVFYKPPVTPAVAAAKQSWLGRVYLDWSKFPLVTDLGNAPIDNAPPPQPNWHTVQFEDLRFGYPSTGRRTPLGAWTYIGPDNEIEGIFMGGREQRQR
ncbi:MAG: metal-dependent hydrolase [Silvibacterium sp.]